MPPLTPEVRSRILSQINVVPLAKVMPYILSGEITVDELKKARIKGDRLAVVTDQLSKMPNPIEQKEWNALLPGINTPTRENYSALKAYVDKWQSVMAPQNHVDEARQALDNMQMALRNAERDQDENMWAHTDRSDRAQLEAYIAAFPAGIHVPEARSCIESIEVMSQIGQYDIFQLSEMIAQMPFGPKADKLRACLNKLKTDEIEKMKQDPSKYDVGTVKKLIDQKIFTRDELVGAEVITKDMLQTLLDPTITEYLPDIGTAIKRSTANCRPGFTDVYFFGVPSTGKTCVLMGLTRSDLAHINLACAGGEYASALMQYVDSSLTVPRTPGSFVTTLEATFRGDVNNPYQSYNVNLVEMSGEEFAFEIANNSKQVYDFESMGTGTTDLLLNDNRKIFFLVIDPTLTRVAVKREVRDHFDAMTGQPVMRTETAVINQALILHRFIDIFKRPENSHIMSKVDGIHLIMTKSDCLAQDRTERDKQAVSHFESKYQHEILQELINLCATYGINSRVTPQYHPHLYPFSLGRFSIGGLYEYESDDSNRLVSGICSTITAYSQQL